MVSNQAQVLRVAALVFLLVIYAQRCHGYAEFADRIPNGRDVYHDGERVPGVGHRVSWGGGAPNQFGIDLQKAGYKWTFELCRDDSDGDGISNGQELGE